MSIARCGSLSKWDSGANSLTSAVFRPAFRQVHAVSCRLQAGFLRAGSFFRWAFAALRAVFCPFFVRVDFFPGDPVLRAFERLRGLFHFVVCV